MYEIFINNNAKIQYIEKEDFSFYYVSCKGFNFIVYIDAAKLQLACFHINDFCFVKENDLRAMFLYSKESAIESSNFEGLKPFKLLQKLDEILGFNKISEDCLEYKGNTLFYFYDKPKSFPVNFGIYGAENKFQNNKGIYISNGFHKDESFICFDGNIAKDIISYVLLPQKYIYKSFIETEDCLKEHSNVHFLIRNENMGSYIACLRYLLYELNLLNGFAFDIEVISNREIALFNSSLNTDADQVFSDIYKGIKLYFEKTYEYKFAKIIDCENIMQLHISLNSEILLLLRDIFKSKKQIIIRP